MGDGIHITYEMTSQVIERLWLRAWLFAILCITSAFGYLALGDRQVREAAFLLLTLFAFFLIAVAIMYRERHKSGVFGLTEDDQRLIAAWIEETNHWWGKPLLRTSLSMPH